jgi:hypothetical protein
VFSFWLPDAKSNWRRGRDSNPRWSCPHSGLANRRTRPLCDLSTGGHILNGFRLPKPKTGRNLPLAEISLGLVHMCLELALHQLNILGQTLDRIQYVNLHLLYLVDFSDLVICVVGNLIFDIGGWFWKSRIVCANRIASTLTRNV